MTELNRQRIVYALADFITANVGFFLFNIGRFFLIPPLSRPATLVDFLFERTLVIEQCIVPLLMVAFTPCGAPITAPTHFISRGLTRQQPHSWRRFL